MPADAIEPVPDILMESGGAEIDSEYIEGVGKQGDGALIILLDLEKLLAAA